jgi:hypothetical protein
MPTLTDPQTLACLKAVLSNWNYNGYITIKDVAEAWLAKNVPGLTLRALAKLMHEHVQAGKKVKYARETRPEWNDWPCHYDFKIAVAGRAKELYVETVLIDDDPGDPSLFIVNVHDA